MLNLKVLVKRQNTKDGKSFNTLTYRSPKGVYYKVRFTINSGISITKLEAGLYDMSVDEKLLSTQIKKNGEYIDNYLWVNDSKCKFTKHTLTEEEIEAKAERLVDELIGE